MATNEDLPKIKLYWLNDSRSQRIMWLLEELKAPYEVEVFHRNKKTMLAPKELEKVHLLGKSPVVTVLPAGAAPGTEPLVLAESGLMTEYLCEHLSEGKRLVPQKWKEGQEGKIGGETEAWMRSRYLLHYAEGSLMPTLVVAFVTAQLKSPAQIPFIARPIASIAANRILSQFVFPNAQKHLRLIESYLETSGGRYLCGDQLTAADILMSFPLIAAKDRWDEMGRFEDGQWAKQFPRVAKYVDLLESEEGYKKSVERIEKIDGKFNAIL